MQENKPVRALDLPTLLREKIPSSRSTIMRRVKSGEFPQPRMCAGKLVWIEHEIDAWIAALPKGGA